MEYVDPETRNRFYHRNELVPREEGADGGRSASTEDLPKVPPLGPCSETG